MKQRPPEFRSVMDTTLSHGRRTLASQPVSVWLAAELLMFGGGFAEISVPIRPDLTQQCGSVHGGIVSYVAEGALGFAGASLLGSEVAISEFKINYLRPAIGDDLIARGAVVHVGDTHVVCRCDVFACRDGRVVHCATAQGTLARRLVCETRQQR